jgi:hypothetical protein
VVGEEMDVRHWRFVAKLDIRLVIASLLAEMEAGCMRPGGQQIFHASQHGSIVCGLMGCAR